MKTPCIRHPASASASAQCFRAPHAFIQQENAPYGILINNANEVRLLSGHIIQIPAGCI
ncbi:MAG: hypothetical protein ACP5I4_14665 [Oceanipulchritudo sp.]